MQRGARTVPSATSPEAAIAPGGHDQEPAGLPAETLADPSSGEAEGPPGDEEAITVPGQRAVPASALEAGGAPVPCTGDADPSAADPAPSVPVPSAPADDRSTSPSQRAVTTFDLGAVARSPGPGGAALAETRAEPAPDTGQRPDVVDTRGSCEQRPGAAPPTPAVADDRTTAPNQRAVTAFDIGTVNGRLANRPAVPQPWTAGAEPIPLRLERAGVTVPSGEHALPSDDVQPEPGEDTPEPPRQAWVSRLEDPARHERMLSRRRMLVRSGTALFAAGAFLHAWGRRPLAAPRGRFRPGAFEPGAWRTLARAFEAVLDDEAAAGSAARQADLLYARLGEAARREIEQGLVSLEFWPGGVLDCRRFCRLDRAGAREVLERWRTSPVEARRRTAATLQRLARYAWAAQAADGPAGPGLR